MSTIVLRSVKGTPLTNTEVDDNFNNLNTDKVEKTAAAITGGSINGTTVGASTASTGAFTTLTTSGAVTHNGGTANGVAYLNGSKVLTTGSALTFDGGMLALSGSGNIARFGDGTNTFDLRFRGANNWSIQYAPSTDEWALQRNSVNQYSANGSSHIWSFPAGEQMRLTSTGLGIGTSSPGAKLHVYGIGQIGIIESSGNYATTGQGYIRWKDVNGNAAYVGYANANNFDIFNALNGAITFSTNSSVKATLDSSGNLGLGVSPSAWMLPTIETQSQMSFGTFGVGRNVYFASGYAPKYIVDGFASRYSHSSSAHFWEIAPSGTAGAAITFTQAMTLDASGRLMVGTTSSGSGGAAKLTVTGNSVVFNPNTDGKDTHTFTTDAVDDGTYSIKSNTIEKVKLHSNGSSYFNGGNFGIGTSSPAQKLQVHGAIYANNSTNVAFLMQGSQYNGSIANTSSANTYSLGYTTDASTHTSVLYWNASGNLGLGVTPSAWRSGDRAFDIGGISALADVQSAATRLVSNAYGVSGGVYIYKTNNFASYYNQQSGQHQWFTALSGTAGDAISFTQAMTLDASGNLGVGTTSPTGRLHIYGSDPAFRIQSSVSGNIQMGQWDGSTNMIQSTARNFRLLTSDAFPITFSTDSTERARIDSSGNLGIGTSSPGARLDVYGAIRSTLAADNNYRAELTNSGGATQLLAVGTGATMQFWVQGSERARITSGGTFLVGKTDTGLTVPGVGIEASGVVGIGTDTATPLFINRQGSDGTLVEFRQADVGEGTISVSGTTVSYNGGHLSRWAQTTAPKDESLVKGTVLSNLDEMNVYTDADGNPVENEQLNKVQVSDVEGDANVAGVFVNWTHDDAHNVDEINMAMTGDMIIRIAQGTTVQRGDLLMSAGDGTAKPQGDDIVRSKTVAKVTSTHVTCTYADGSFCVPCVLMAC